MVNQPDYPRVISHIHQALRTSVAPSLPPITHTYQDYVHWQRELVEGETGEHLWKYWQQKLSGELPVLNLPTDRPRPAIQTDNGAAYPVQVSEQLTQELKALAQSEGVTLYILLLAAFQVLLSRYSGQEDILVGSPTSGRTNPDFDAIVGYFVDFMVMRSTASENLQFSRLSSPGPPDCDGSTRTSGLSLCVVG